MNRSLNHKFKTNWNEWFKFVAVAVIFPVFSVFYSLHYVEKLQVEMRLQQFQVDASNQLEITLRAGNANEFICRSLLDIYKKSDSPMTMKTEVVRFSHNYQLDLQILVWNHTKEVFWSNFDFKARNADWSGAWQSLYEISSGKRDFLELSEEVNLRRIFGPHFFPRYHYHTYWDLKPRFSHGDSAGKWPLCWVNASSRKGLMVQIWPEKLRDYHVLRQEVLGGKGKFASALLLDGELVSASDVFSNFSPGDMQKIEASFENLYEIGGFYLYKVNQGEKVTGIAALAKEKITGLVLSDQVKMLLAAFFLYVAAMLVGSFLVCIVGIKIVFNIRKQLIFLFLLSNSIPMLIMGVIGYDYLIQYENFLQIDAYTRGLTYLQSVDEMFVSELSHHLVRMNQVFTWLPEQLKKSSPDRKIIERVLAQQIFEPFRLVLIGSHTEQIASEIGIMKDGVFIDVIDKNYSQHKTLQNLIDFLDKLGKYYLSKLNQESISEKNALQIELIAESLGQLKPMEMMQEFFAATGDFWQWGMGRNYFPAHIRVLSLFDERISDYAFLCLYKPNLLQFNYFKRIFQTINRNPFNLKIFALNEQLTYSVPPESLSREFVNEIARLMRNKRGSEIEFCQWQGQRHMIIGLKCQNLDRLRLLGLYPMDEVSRKAREKFHLFMASGVLHLLIALSLGLLISRSFLLPLHELQHGVEALKRQDFNYRLPDLGHDEFGSLARIFNDTLVDLEEMHVATVVEEKIFHDFSTLQTHGKIAFSGITLRCKRSGGDFVDWLFLDERKSAFIIGDVTGHGISTCLVRAFLKACFIQLIENAADPCYVLNRVAEMFDSAGSGRKKIFASLQYVLVDHHNRAISLANCGHCFPVILNSKTGAINFVKAPGTLLGATVKPRIGVADFKLEPDERLVLYSGGMFLAKDNGFEEFIVRIKSAKDLALVDFCKHLSDWAAGQDYSESGTDDISIICIGEEQATSGKIRKL